VTKKRGGSGIKKYCLKNSFIKILLESVAIVGPEGEGPRHGRGGGTTRRLQSRNILIVPPAEPWLHTADGFAPPAGYTSLTADPVQCSTDKVAVITV
jgi:hypothetical protein